MRTTLDKWRRLVRAATEGCTLDLGIKRGQKSSPHIVVRLPCRDGQVICKRQQGVKRPVADVRLMVLNSVSAIATAP